MPLDMDGNEHRRILHKETLEVFESLERLGDRFSDPSHRLTDDHRLPIERKAEA